jgi:hypothetical protein
MSDLIERLLAEAEHRTRVGPKVVLLNEAADALEDKDAKIARLKAKCTVIENSTVDLLTQDNIRLRAALEEIVEADTLLGNRPPDYGPCADIARKALEGDRESKLPGPGGRERQ